MERNTKIELARIIRATNKRLDKEFDPSKPHNSIQVALAKECRDQDALGLLRLAMYWPDDCDQWARKILGERP